MQGKPCDGFSIVSNTCTNRRAENSICSGVRGSKFTEECCSRCGAIPRGSVKQHKKECRGEMHASFANKKIYLVKAS